MSEDDKKQLLAIIDSRTDKNIEYYCGTIIDDEYVTSDKKDYRYYKAVNINTSHSFEDGNYFCLLNKTNKHLKKGDSVLIHAINGDLSNAYIMLKFGKESFDEGVVLYEDGKGSYDYVILDDDTRKMKSIEIYYSKAGGYSNVLKVDNPHNKKVSLQLSYCETSLFQIQSKVIKIFMDVIEVVGYGILNFNSSNNFQLLYNNEIRIDKVVGYYK